MGRLSQMKLMHDLNRHLPQRAHLSIYEHIRLTVKRLALRQQLVNFCDRIGLVYRGQMIATGTPDELKAKVRAPGRPNPTLEDAFIALVEEHDAKTSAGVKGGGTP